MNKKIKGIGKIVAKAATIIGLAGGASLASDMFLFGGKFGNNDEDDDEKATDNKVTMPDISDESEHIDETEVIVEDTNDKEDEG